MNLSVGWESFLSFKGLEFEHRWVRKFALISSTSAKKRSNGSGCSIRFDSICLDHIGPPKMPS